MLNIWANGQCHQTYMCYATITSLQDFENKEQGVFCPYAASDFIGWWGGGVKSTTGRTKNTPVLCSKIVVHM